MSRRGAALLLIGLIGLVVPALTPAADAAARQPLRASPWLLPSECEALGEGPSAAWVGQRDDEQPTPCRTLPYPAGATLGVVAPFDSGGDDLSVYDATGTRVCEVDSGAAGPVCVLRGPGPFRAAYDGFGDTHYAFALVRLDTPVGCAALPTGAFSTRDGADVTIPAGSFATCLTVPAAESTSRTLYSLERTAGAGSLGLQVRNASPGVCYSQGYLYGSNESAVCRADGASPVSVVVTTEEESTASARVVRRSLAPGSSDGCLSPPADAAIGAIATGRLDSTVDIDCYLLSAAATDVFLTRLRAGDDTYDQLSVAVWDDTVTDTTPCLEDDRPRPCTFTGSTRYRLLVQHRNGGGRLAYQLPILRLRTAAGPNPSCAAVDPRRGLAGRAVTLDDAHPLLCLAVPQTTAGYLVDAGSATPLFHVSRVGARRGDEGDCSGVPYSSPFSCGGFGAEPGDVGFLVLTRPTAGPDTVKLGFGVACNPTGTESPCLQTPVTATSKPRVTGRAQVGSALTASPGGWAPEPGVHGYQWLVDGNPVPGATGRTFALTSACADRRVSVRVSAVRDHFAPGSATSTASIVARGPAPSVRTRPTVAGSHRAGATVTVSRGTWSTTPSAYRFAWTVGGRVVANHTRRLRLTAAMVGKRVAVTVYALVPGHVDGHARPVGFTVLRRK